MVPVDTQAVRTISRKIDVGIIKVKRPLRILLINISIGECGMESAIGAGVLSPRSARNWSIYTQGCAANQNATYYAVRRGLRVVTQLLKVPS